MHPRTLARAKEWGLDAHLDRIRVTEPLGYAEMVALLDGAAAVVTDSGGLQEETTALGVPCVTVRAQTERPITVQQGTNRMVPWPPSITGIERAVADAIARGRVTVGAASPDGWDGAAAARIVDAICGVPGAGDVSAPSERVGGARSRAALG